MYVQNHAWCNFIKPDILSWFRMQYHSPLQWLWSTVSLNEIHEKITPLYVIACIRNHERLTVWKHGHCFRFLTEYDSYIFNYYTYVLQLYFRRTKPCYLGNVSWIVFIFNQFERLAFVKLEIKTWWIINDKSVAKI